MSKKQVTNPAVERLKLIKVWSKKDPNGLPRTLLRVYDDLARVHGTETYFGFKLISDRTGIEYRRIRKQVRWLRRWGLTEYSSGLFDWDGNVAGSGYKITPAGIALLEAIEGSNENTP